MLTFDAVKKNCFVSRSFTHAEYEQPNSQIIVDLI